MHIAHPSAQRDMYNILLVKPPTTTKKSNINNIELYSCRRPNASKSMIYGLKFHFVSIFMEICCGHIHVHTHRHKHNIKHTQYHTIMLIHSHKPNVISYQVYEYYVLSCVLVYICVVQTKQQFHIKIKHNHQSTMISQFNVCVYYDLTSFSQHTNNIA